MNIQAITPISYAQNRPIVSPLNSRPTIRQNNLNYLTKDTVSFSGGVQNIKKPVETIEDLIIKEYEKQNPLYKSLGTRLMDTTEAIANKFEKRGVKFYRSYCEGGVVKSTKSFLSKFRRSGESPYDRVRTTLCVENPYDFKLIRDIINEYKLRGYEISKIPAKTSGRKVLKWKPDFDIRLPGVTEEDTKVLGAELQNCIGKPQSSGYSDIQFRLQDKTSSNKDAPPLEVLIVFGKNTLAAKELESYYSYDIRRELQNEMRINNVPNPKINTPAYRVQNNIAIISDILKNMISKPLFYNAKNRDFYHTKELLPVGLEDSQIKTITGLLEGTRSKISLHYNGEIKKVNSDEYKPELERVFKESEEYKERTDKTVYIQDLLNTKRMLIKDLKFQKEKDLETLHKAKERFEETASTDITQVLKEFLVKIKE